MTTLLGLYKKYINGIIITLIFHILVFASLDALQLNMRKENKEAEIRIDFPMQEPEQNVPDENNRLSAVNEGGSDHLKTNVASSKTALQKNKSFDDQYQQELEKAQKLVKDVNEQLTKEIPTIEDLKMPEAPKSKSDDIKDKIYTGDSNIEYFLENRFHIKLPIPVYLAEGGGKVKVNIVVDQTGNVISADPVVEANLSDQVLSYAKTAALRTKFNPLPSAPSQQKGYLIYNFIPQN
jgi:hypothetical protein